MTTAEARYVIDHRHLYSEADLRYALDVIESAERQAAHA